jgi:hypothetical protein
MLPVKQVMRVENYASTKKECKLMDEYIRALSSTCRRGLFANNPNADIEPAVCASHTST